MEADLAEVVTIRVGIGWDVGVAWRLLVSVSASAAAHRFQRHAPVPLLFGTLMG